MGLKVLSWNIEHINVTKFTANAEKIASFMSPYDVIFILENKVHSDYIASLFLMILKDAKGSWSSKIVDVGGTLHTYEKILCFYNKNSVSDLSVPYNNEVMAKLFSGAPFNAVYDKNILQSTFRLPAIFTVTKNSQEFSIAAMHAPGPDQKANNQNAKTAVSHAFMILKKLGTAVCIGDFNLDGTCELAGDRFQASDASKKGRGDNGFFWVGDGGGTTFAYSGGVRSDKLSDHTRDRVYVNAEGAKSVNCNVTPKRVAEEHMGIYQYTDHIPIEANLYKYTSLELAAFPDLMLEHVEKPKISALSAKVAKPLLVNTIPVLTGSIDLQQLAVNLQQQVDKNQNFVLSDTSLGVQGLDALIQQSPLQVASIPLAYTGKIPTVQNNKLVISGANWNALNQTQLITQVTFWVANGQLALAVEATLVDSWQLASAFSEMQQDAYLGQLRFNKPSFIFIAGLIPQGEPLSQFNNTPGLVFAGLMPLQNQGPCAWLSNLWTICRHTPLPTSLAVAGPVSKSAGLILNLQGQLPAPPLNLPVLSQNFTGNLQAIYNSDLNIELADFSVPDSGVYLQGELACGQQSWPVMIFDVAENSFLVGYEGAQASLKNLDDLIPLLGGDLAKQAWQSLLPDALYKILTEVTAAIKLQSMSVALSVGTIPSIDFVDLQLLANLSWSLFDIASETLSLNWLSLNIAAIQPFDSANHNYSWTIASEISLGAKKDKYFDLALTVPDLIAYGSLCLAADNNISLKEILTDITGIDVAFIPDDLAAFELDYIGLEVDIPNKTYTCSIYGKLELLGIYFQGIACCVSYDAVAKQFVTKSLVGFVNIASVSFEVACDLTQTDPVMQLGWKAQDGQSVTINDLLLDLNVPINLPDELSFGLQQANLLYHFKKQLLTLEANLQIDGVNVIAVLVILPGADAKSSSKTLLYIDVPLSTNFGALPVIGSMPSPVAQLQLISASANFVQNDLLLFNNVLSTFNIQINADSIVQGTSLAFSIVGQNNLIFLPLGGNNSTSASTHALAVSGNASSSNKSVNDIASVKWIKLQKSFGPINLMRLGLSYQDAKLWISLDGSIMLDVLAVELDGLKVGIPLQSPQNFSAWSFNLDGLGLDYDAGIVALNGNFFKDSNLGEGVIERYSGGATMQMEEFCVAAIGSYAKLASDACSVFIFARAKAPLGGPPFFYVTGFAGGFGYNQRLRIPSQDNVIYFPLVQGSVDPTALPDDLMTVEQNLLKGDGVNPPWLIAEEGQDWFAAGIDFTTFELIGSRALAVIEFGQDFQLAILGRSSMQLPKVGTPIAYIEMGLEAVFKPAEGVLAVSALISPNSYVLTQDCHLAGGFAFYSWFKDQMNGANAGDFVFTMGGYHPAFIAPAWYPQVPRLGFLWQVSNNISINGDAYFALTPSAAMAGGHLHALFHAGDLRAWFNTGADFLIEWHPFHYEADVDISVGASYKLNLGFTSVTLSVEIGADLYLWGPSTGGYVHVDWHVISFSIPFGASRNQTDLQPITWQGFRNLLPRVDKPTSNNNKKKSIKASAVNDTSSDNQQVNLVRILSTQGLSRQITRPDKSICWIVRADEFCFRTEVAIPATSININNTDIEDEKGKKAPDNEVNIKPMQISALSHAHVVNIDQVELDAQGNIASVKNPEPPFDINTWNKTVIKRNVPAALWGKPTPGLNLGADASLDTSLLDNHWMGLAVQAPASKQGNSPGAIPIKEAFSNVPVKDGALPLDVQPTIMAAPISDTASRQTIRSSIATTAVQPRKDLISSLQKIGLFSKTVNLDSMNLLAANAGKILQEPPLRIAKSN